MNDTTWIQRRGVGWLALPALLFCCQPTTVDLNNRPCGNQPCVEGYACHPETDICVPTVNVGCGQAGAICPSQVTAGDPCPSVGSFIPCVDEVNDCSQGCRTCEEDLTWSECSSGECESCTTYYRDDDDDGVGRGDDSVCTCTADDPYDTETAGDCDDSVATGATCTTGCTTFYPDNDRDGFGDLAGAVSACEMPTDYVANSSDCNDAKPYCTINCTDIDQDDYCVGFDCHDGDNTCTDDCSGCPPTSLLLTVLTPPPIHPSDLVELSIDLGAYGRDASSEISCEASSQVLQGPADFSAPTLASLGWSGNKYEFGENNGAPFDELPACEETGRFVILQTHNAAEIHLADALDVAGYGTLSVSFRAAVEDGYAGGDILSVQSCCGVGCNPEYVVGGAIQPADIGDANACSIQTVPLPEYDCVNLMVRLDWGNFTRRVGLDDVQIEGAAIIPPVTIDSPGVYTTSFTPLATGTINITCTWKNDAIGPEQTDSADVIVE